MIAVTGFTPLGTVLMSAFYAILIGALLFYLIQLIRWSR